MLNIDILYRTVNIIDLLSEKFTGLIFLATIPLVSLTEEMFQRKGFYFSSTYNWSLENEEKLKSVTIIF